MTIMLVVLFASTGVGLLAGDWARRQKILCFGLATLLTLLYFFHPAWMT
jgi:hypothetical protein